MTERQDSSRRPAADSGRLTARPTNPPTGELLPPGLHRLGLDRERDALLYVPPGLRFDQPVPVVVMLHGAGGEADHGISPLQRIADDQHFLLLSPPSRGRSWDIIVRQRYGPDIAFLDASLEATFVRFPVDRDHIAIAGFSDGASYALSVGLMNGDLFTHVLGFAPGYMAPLQVVGVPAVYIAHGTLDLVLNIDRCSRRIVPQLKGAGYNVRYREFIGPHTIPKKIAREAIDWFIDGNEQ